MKNKNVLGLIKKNYNNQLEAILEYKEYTENSKSFLLSMLYKIEVSYSDYKKTKEDVLTKEEYINNLLKIIKKELKVLELEKVKKTTENTFSIEKQQGKIIAYPIDRKVIYAIYKLANQEDVVKGENNILNKTITELINIGSNIDKVEVIRDFNGYSWATHAKEIESIEYNIIYQNLRMLIGSNEISKLTDKEFLLLDNYGNMLEIIRSNYGEENKEKIQKGLEDISLLLFVKYKKEECEEIYKQKEILDKELESMKDHTEYMQSLMAKKARIENKIQKINRLLANEESLENEYEKRNKKLPLEKKIFSKRILFKILEEEKREYIIRKEQLSEDIGFNKYVQKKDEVIKKQKVYLILPQEKENEEMLEQIIKKEIIQIQKILLNCFEKQIENIKNKEEILSKIKIFRYYLEIYINETEKIRSEDELKQTIVYMQKKIINKALELNAIAKLDLNILTNIFNTKIMNLADVEFKIVKSELEIYDENILDEKKVLDIENISKETKNKLNKKIKILT